MLSPVLVHIMLVVYLLLIFLSVPELLRLFVGFGMPLLTLLAYS